MTARARPPAFFQLGALADRLGRTEDGARLVALCWLIDHAIGHGDADSDFHQALGLCVKAGLDEARIKTLIADVAAAYEADRGRSLIERAFGTEPGDGGSATAGEPAR